MTFFLEIFLKWFTFVSSIISKDMETPEWELLILEKKTNDKRNKQRNHEVQQLCKTVINQTTNKIEQNYICRKHSFLSQKLND